jgi:predicted acyltransferase (DUF342 family)
MFNLTYREVFKMKKLLVAVACSSLLAACGSTSGTKQVELKQINQNGNSIMTIPEWFSNVPENTDDIIFAVGDGVSASASGAISNARASAFEGICQTVGGKVRSQTKVFRHDTETASSSVTTTAIRNICPDVDVTGAAVVQQAMVQDGRRIRAYVLVGLPLGDKNKLAQIKQNYRTQKTTEANRDAEFKELDTIVEGEKLRTE